MQRLIVNGQCRTVVSPPTRLLVDVLREECGLLGTNQGCDTAQCGACTVLVNGAAVKSCNVLWGQIAAMVPTATITTIEGVGSADGRLHPLQVLFSQHHALQCGYCTPGFILRALAMPAEGVPANAQAVAAALEGNICRCTGYTGIVNAIVAWLQSGAPGIEESPR